jgi:hypothetical protein
MFKLKLETESLVPRGGFGGVPDSQNRRKPFSRHAEILARET